MVLPKLHERERHWDDRMLSDFARHHCKRQMSPVFLGAHFYRNGLARDQPVPPEIESSGSDAILRTQRVGGERSSGKQVGRARLAAVR